MSNDPLDETIRAASSVRNTQADLHAEYKRLTALIENMPSEWTADEMHRLKGLRNGVARDIEEAERNERRRNGIHGWPVSEDLVRGDMTGKLRDGTELVLVKAATYIHPATLDELKRVGWGTCHMQGPDGILRLVSVSIVSTEVDPWESYGKPGPDVMFQRAKAMSNELFGMDVGRPWPHPMTEAERVAHIKRDYDARKAVIHDGEGNLIIDDLNAIQPDETARRAAYQAAYRKTLMGQYEEVQDIAHDMGRVLMRDLRDLWAIVRGWFGRQ